MSWAVPKSYGKKDIDLIDEGQVRINRLRERFSKMKCSKPKNSEAKENLTALNP